MTRRVYQVAHNKLCMTKWDLFGWGATILKRSLPSDRRREIVNGGYALVPTLITNSLMPATRLTADTGQPKVDRQQRVDLKVPTFDGHLNESNIDLRRCSMEYTPRRKLTREFKLEAVRQTALSEKPKAQVARELGVRVGQLRTWRLEFEKEAVTGIAKPDRSVAEDLEQLRRENAKLKMEIEILKKAAIYFAREAK